MKHISLPPLSRILFTIIEMIKWGRKDPLFLYQKVIERRASTLLHSKLSYPNELEYCFFILLWVNAFWPFLWEFHMLECILRVRALSQNISQVISNYCLNITSWRCWLVQQKKSLNWIRHQKHLWILKRSTYVPGVRHCKSRAYFERPGKSW